MFYSLILKIKIIYLPKTQQIYKCTASGSHHHPRTNNHRHKLQPQSPNPSTNSKSKSLNQKKKKKKTENLQQNLNPTDQSMTKLNQPSAMRAVDDDEQRSATAPGRAELQMGEQRLRLASFNRRALLQIGIAFFFMTGKERKRDSDRKKKRKRTRSHCEDAGEERRRKREEGVTRARSRRWKKEEKK